MLQSKAILKIAFLFSPIQLLSKAPASSKGQTTTKQFSSISLTTNPKTPMLFAKTLSGCVPLRGGGGG
ncbi:hypothetical protein, partial [Helicobacter bizzozeronii]|uniref:hypothetical protein n=1 Tax=Helicobacter bizzozeronii TaxID=56877 RepID=UPI001F3DD051